MNHDEPMRTDGHRRLIDVLAFNFIYFSCAAFRDALVHRSRFSTVVAVLAVIGPF